MSFMSVCRGVPNINKYSSNYKYRKAYAEFYMKNCKNRIKNRNSSLEECKLISHAFNE